MDTALFYLINRLPHFDWLDRIVILISDIQQREAYIALAAVLLFGLLFKKHGVWQATLVLIVAFLLVDSLVWTLKPIVNRPRPVDALEGVLILGGNAGGASFPSSNAANVAVLFAYVYFVTRKKLAVWAGLIFLLGILRVYKGIHYPGDVAGGWIMGIAGAWAASLLYRFVHEKFHIKGRP